MDMKLEIFLFFVCVCENIQLVICGSPVVNETECTTESCYAAAKILKFNMDTHVDPCEDFYQFACGGYINRTVLPQGAWFKNYYTVLDEQIRNIIHDVVSQPIAEKDHYPTQLIKQIYSLCTDIEKLNQSGIFTLLKVFDSLGGFPMLSESWSHKNFSLSEYLVKLMDLGFTQDTLFSMSVFESDDGEPQFKLGKADFAGRRGMLSKGRETSKVKEYFKYMNETIVALGGNSSKIQKDLEDILDFEIELAEIASGVGKYTIPDEEEEEIDIHEEIELNHNDTSINNSSIDGTSINNTSIDGTSINSTVESNSILAQTQNDEVEDEEKPILVKDLDEMYPGFPWIKYINESFSIYHNLTFNESVEVLQPEYYTGFSNLTKHTSNRILCNFLLWRMVDYYANALPFQIQQIKKKYDTIFEVTDNSQPRKEMCLETIQEKFKVEVGFMFVKSYNKTHEKSAREIAEQIRSTYIETFINATWMENSTRQAAIDKVSKMRFDISYPQSLDNVTFLDEYYSDLSLQNESFLKSLLEIGKFERNKVLKNRFAAGVKVDIDFLESISTAAAAYESDGNSIAIPATILREIFYAYNRTGYLNFGGIGTVMGRRIAQGFDDEGIKIDADGSIRNWWDNKTKIVYMSRSKCLVDQYNNITLTGGHVNGINTLNSNIDDNLGVKQSYKAYLKWIQQNGPEKRLPNFPYTPKQSFWIEYAATMCEKMLEMFTFGQDYDSESPKKYRVNMVLGNIQYFKQDWNCTVGNKMVLNHTCTMW